MGAGQKSLAWILLGKIELPEEVPLRMSQELLALILALALVSWMVRRPSLQDALASCQQERMLWLELEGL